MTQVGKIIPCPQSPAVSNICYFFLVQVKFRLAPCSYLQCFKHKSLEHTSAPTFCFNRFRVSSKNLNANKLPGDDGTSGVTSTLRMLWAKPIMTIPLSHFAESLVQIQASQTIHANLSQSRNTEIQMASR